MLLEGGWKPLQADLWVIPDGLRTASLRNSAASQLEVLTVFREIREEQLWVAASEHFGGAGLETGIPSFEPARRARKLLLKKGLAAEAAVSSFI